MSRVFVVEDEAHLAQGLRFNLEAEGYDVEISGDGEEALERLLGSPQFADVVVLDVMLPGKNGFEVVSALREKRNYVPVLILTARGRAEDVLQGFASGADDYLPKPFELPIFLARLQGLLRRRKWLQTGGPPPAEKDVPESGQDTFEINGKTIDFANLELKANGNVVQLTLMEAKLLRHLIRNQGRTVSRKSILEDVWGLSEDTDTRAIDNFIVRLRRYLEKDPTKPEHLLTVRGIGYKLVQTRRK